MNEQQAPPPFMVVFKLNEGYVLDYGAYTVALTSPADLAKRVQSVAEQSEVGFRDPDPVQVSSPHPGPSPLAAPPSPELREATAVPSALERVGDQDGVVPTIQLETEWENVRKMIAFMAAGFDSSGKAFTRKEWDYGVAQFAPHVDPKEAEFELSEFLGSLHDDE
jgi:hypothetical protein